MKKFIERMKIEAEELDGRILRASKAIENPPYGSDKHGLLLLAEQLKIMKEYERILAERIEYERTKSN